MRCDDFTSISELLRETNRSGEYLQDKLLVDVAFGHGGLEIWALQETQKELIDQLTKTQTTNIYLVFTHPSICDLKHLSC